jgi:hypothetical protein
MWYAWEGGEACTKFWWESLKEKGHFERPRRRWEDGIKMYLREVGLGVEWIHLVQDRNRWWPVVNAVMNIQVLTPWS